MPAAPEYILDAPHVASRLILSRPRPRPGPRLVAPGRRAPRSEQTFARQQHDTCAFTSHNRLARRPAGRARDAWSALGRALNKRDTSHCTTCQIITSHPIALHQTPHLKHSMALNSGALAKKALSFRPSQAFMLQASRSPQ